MTMKKIYEKPFMKDHKLLHTNHLLLSASKNDGKVDKIISDFYSDSNCSIKREISPKKEVKYYIFFPLGNIVWGSHQPHFFVLIPMETVYVFLLDALYDF